MTALKKAAEALDEYAGHAADGERPGTIPVPLKLLRALRQALKESGK